MIANVIPLVALLGLLVAGPAGSGHASPPSSPMVIDGRTITDSDISAFFEGFYSARRRPQSHRLAEISKASWDMPSDAPLVSYQGRDSGPPTKQVVWISTARTAANDPQYGDAYFAALALVVMDEGNAGPTLQALYARTGGDRAARQALGDAFVRAFNAASARRAAVAAGQAAWIRARLVPGTTRAAAYRMLESKGLTAYNSAFVKGKSLPGNWCDSRDRSTGAWPYMNERLPKREGGCAVGDPPKPMRNPAAEIDLAGAFNIACGWSTRVTVTFSRRDRVAAVHVSQPIGGCL